MVAALGSAAGHLLLPCQQEERKVMRIRQLDGEPVLELGELSLEMMLTEKFK